ncbi:hypothetical protein N7466_003198 [Penicillium verhagenii]|uniref:uncharacterized protein n=1 Tax=Penicillium verhagenii TaxID=1562060 RepID=UPI0025451BE5|nr:uncharacterized protein N7466_003198 [Penicillium verhagenii]KAJ5936748.1 hypothetical protein N7466_003198 [Penicillium verhagenii]
MAQTVSPNEAGGAWNPASLPENSIHEAAANRTDTTSSDISIANTAQETINPEVKSPLSDDDFSAWDMPEDTPAVQPEPASLDSVLADEPLTPEETSEDSHDNGAMVLDQAHTDPSSLTATQSDPLELPISPVAPGQPEPSKSELSAAAEAAQVESAEPSAMFASNDDSTDFSALLTADKEIEDALEDPREPDLETASENLAVEHTIPVEAPLPETTEPDTIFPSNEDSVDFSDLLTKDPEVENSLDREREIGLESVIEVAPVEHIPMEASILEISETDSIFKSTEDPVDFSELLAKDREDEELPNQPLEADVEASSETLAIESMPIQSPPVESQHSEESPAEHLTLGSLPGESSSITAVFESSGESDDFSALLSANAESPPAPPSANLPDVLSAPIGNEQPTDDTTVESWPVAPANEEQQFPVEEDNNPSNGQVAEESLQFPTEPAFEAPVASHITLDETPVWGNQASQELDSDGDDFFNQLKTQTKPIFAPEAESRFEEGVPLLDENSSPSPEITVQDDHAVTDLFANGNDDTEDFFSAVKQSETNEEPPHLTRKSTTQVMKSVGFDIDSPTSDISAAAQFEDAIKATSSESLGSQPPTSVPAPPEDDLAARWEAELSDAEEDDLAARWEAALDLDDDMEDDLKEVSQHVPQSPMIAMGLNSPFETPQQRQTPPRPIPGVYVPHQPSTADLVGGVDFPGAPPGSSSIPPYYTQQPPNPVTTRGESFAERSKEGYKSPYDLPDDLSSGPRRPVLTHKPTPPKVDNSMPPPPPPGSNFDQQATPHAAPPPAPKNFFEELPLPPPRSRPASSGRYTPGPSGPTMNPPSVGPPPQSPYASLPVPAPVSAPGTSAGALPLPSPLQPPELLDPYGPSGMLASSAPAGPPAASRYSPMPPTLQPSGNKPPSVARYSPAPPASTSAGRNRYASQPLGVPGQGANLPFQPRTSSPLAYHEKVSYQPDGALQQQPPLQPPSLQPSVDLSPPRQRSSIDHGSPYAPQLPQGSGYGINQAAGSPPAGAQQKARYAPQEYMNQFTQRMAPNGTYAPVPPVADVQPAFQPTEPAVLSPRRSQSQSPGQQLTSPRAFVPPLDTLPRPASVHGSSSPTKTVNPYAPQQAASRARAASRASQQLEFIAPTDGQEQDPLQRWKGAPIFKFGFGGAVVSCFPKHIPRYSAGVPVPMIKPTLGEPRYSQLDAWLPTGDTIVPHPGPLKAKSKKKDVLTWLSSKIAAFENEEVPNDYNPHNPDIQKRREEKILLWKITKILVENDGTFEGSPEIQKSLRNAIFPNLADAQAEASYGNSLPIGGPLNLPSRPDAVDAQWSEELRTHLLLGEREKAVWAAVDRRLWGHAMVIASTMDKSIWKQVVQEFVRREVRATGGNTESIAALYEIFAGNVEESIDELVPPSARAGHQLISKADGQGASRNALDGLESWRDTLGLVLSNRSSDDNQALLALGNLLASYGRIEAAHICFIFSRGAVFGGADDPQTNIVLLGADHQRLPCSLLNDDSILLTEIYEFATSVLGNSPVATLPHLLAFKLMHAKYLADRGRKTDAQSYCDALATSLKSTTRPSPYHHQHLFTEIDELSARLRQAASDGTSSWISKPSMEKVSGSMWARFNSFVVGDENDAASTGSGRAGEASDFGPFAHVAGTPTVSRSPSVSDLYGSYPGAGAQGIPPAAIPAANSSRYLPTNQYASNGSPEQSRGRSSMDSQRSASGGLSFGQRRLSQEPETPVDSMFPGAPMYGSPGNAAYQATPPHPSYMPLAPVKEDSTQSPADATQTPVNGLFYQPPPQDNGSAGQSPYYQGPPGMPQAENSGYMPPAAPNSYEPPSYAPVMSLAPEEIDPEQEQEEAPKPKKSFMDGDDEDDLVARVANLKLSQKEENDRKADEAFRKAAEEDAKRGDQQAQKKGWFGGWFGGAAKKEADNAGGGPIRAKLGEESSFYYDNDLKKWVNKKDPNSSAAVRATPPPPRSSAPPSRASSGSMPPPPAPMSVASSSRPQSSSSDVQNLSSSPAFPGLSVPPPLPRSVSTSGAMSSTPPRPTSSLSHAQSIDDLLGAPTARKGGNNPRGRKKGRYVDVMAQ